MASASDWSRAFWPCLLYGATILVLSSLPGQSLPATTLLRMDKLLHAVEYALLAGLVVRGLVLHRPHWRRSTVLLLAVATGAGFGVFDEIYQRLTPGRSSSILDVVADAAGALLGALLAIWLLHRRQEIAGARARM
jgi:VanZ family protein